ncbi:TadE family protein [Xylanimonas allomyrinae]|nr:TadE family protein [Xylanimonas allomyrinae]
MAIVFPAVLALMFLGIQSALYFHARTVALTAATEGVKAAAAEHGQAADGTATALAFVADAGGDDVLPDAAATATTSATTATVQVTGHSMSVIPGWTPDITATATAPREALR